MLERYTHYLWEPGKLGIVFPSQTEAQRESVPASRWSRIQTWINLISKVLILFSESCCLREGKAPKTISLEIQYCFPLVKKTKTAGKRNACMNRVYGGIQRANDPPKSTAVSSPLQYFPPRRCTCGCGHPGRLKAPGRSANVMAATGGSAGELTASGLETSGSF